MPPDKREKRGKADRGGEKPKEKKRRRKVKKDSGEELKKLEDKVPSIAKTKIKHKTKRKIRRNQLAKMIEKPSGFPISSRELEEKENVFTIRKPGGLAAEGKRVRKHRKKGELKALHHDR